MWDSIWINANLVTMDGEGSGIVQNAALAVEKGRIVFAGAQDDLPDHPEALARTIHDARGQWITPGLIDCHTHLVWGGNRAREFEMRLNGATYEDIAKAGGGILSTVKATRDASEDTLFNAALPRLQNLMREGVTAIEIKSGYGLDTETERKMLRVATRLRDEAGITIQRTFLGAHALPPEYKDRADDYIDLVCNEMMPALQKENLVDAVDVFCETIGFSPAQTERVFQKAQALGLPVKLHAEQLSNQHGASLTARYKGLSADHLEHLDEDGIKAMAKAGTVAVLLPGAFYFLRETKVPPIDLLRKHRVPIALATDMNPGSSPAHSLLLMLNMACTFFRMTPEETLAGVTKNAAKALGKSNTGILKPGYRADFALWDIQEPAELSYRFGFNPCTGVSQGGKFRDFALSRKADSTASRTGFSPAARNSL
ncbi:MAG: imidazolonepropionase [Alphaproteobacteria bacterium CG_4_9_14_3_um_filter_47_13]|nr:MAG: imidazolonepropionase [Alphaproteobacteria bacterium CG_4_9_14_3_um_filter_47_13]